MRLLPASLIVVVCLAGSAQAATLHRLEATTRNSNVSSFEITFDDRNADGMFGRQELLSFSGVHYYSTASFYDQLGRAPQIDNVSSGRGSSWRFSSSTGKLVAPTAVWNYRLTSVPEIDARAGLAALAGLGALMALLRERRRPMPVRVRR
jgi:hypothetical protein